VPFGIVDIQVTVKINELKLKLSAHLIKLIEIEIDLYQLKKVFPG